MSDNAARVNALIRDVTDWPKPGILFKDITPLLADAEGFRLAVEELTALAPGPIDVVVGMEARGFIFAAPVALNIGAGFVPVRKPGKLPWETTSESFALEYGSETLTMHTDALWPGARVMVVDDVPRNRRNRGSDGGSREASGCGTGPCGRAHGTRVPGWPEQAA